MNEPHSVNEPDSFTDVPYNWFNFLFFQTILAFKFRIKGSLAGIFKDHIQIELVIKEAVETNDVQMLHCVMYFNFFCQLLDKFFFSNYSLFYGLHCTYKTCFLMSSLIIAYIIRFTSPNFPLPKNLIFLKAESVILGMYTGAGSGPSSAKTDVVILEQ